MTLVDEEDEHPDVSPGRIVPRLVAVGGCCIRRLRVRCRPTGDPSQSSYQAPALYPLTLETLPSG